MLNFGENVSFQPRHHYTPESEQEVLAILDRHAVGTIRVAGSLHAWSRAVATDDVLIDLRRLDRVEVVAGTDGLPSAIVGGGCTLERLVTELQPRGITLPTVGAVLKQTLAGAIATGTHGSGGPSLSHFVEAVRVAAFDPASGRARVFEFTDGDALRAARCALGCMGVVLSVRLRCRREFWVQERLSHEASLEAVLARRAEYPLQQFMLIPYAWQFVAFNRREMDAPPGAFARIASRVYRRIDTLTLELLPHQLLSKLLLRATPSGRPASLLRRFLQHVLPRSFRAPPTALPSIDALTLHTRHHAAVRHVEMEVFVPDRHLAAAVGLLRALIAWSAGTAPELPAAVRADFERAGLSAELDAVRGRYMQHYPLFFRRVLADDAMISMTSDGIERYSISLFTYLPEAQRGGYYALCALVARVLCRVYEARLHWGKYFPLALEDIADGYAELAAFRRHCVAVDARGAFVNGFAERVLGLSHAADGTPTAG